MVIIDGYRYDATGVFGYMFYKHKQKICTLNSLVVPSPPIQINGFGNDWKSEFDEDSTIVPGLTRYVYDKESEQEVFRIVYKENGKFDILIGGSCSSANVNNDSYHFIMEGIQVASVEKVYGTYDWLPPNTEYEIEPYFRVNVLRQMEQELMLAILAFPILRFAI